MVLLEMTMNFFCCTKEVSLFSPTEWFLRFWFVLESRLISGEIFKMSEVSVILDFSSELKMIVYFPPQKVFLDSRWIFFLTLVTKNRPKNFLHRLKIIVRDWLLWSCSRMNRVTSMLCSMRFKQNFIKLQFSFCGFCGCQQSFASNKLLRVKFPQEEDNIYFYGGNWTTIILFNTEFLFDFPTTMSPQFL